MVTCRMCLSRTFYWQQLVVEAAFLSLTNRKQREKRDSKGNGYALSTLLL